MISPRFGAGVSRQAGSASSAARTAAATSAASLAAKWPITSRASAGLRDSKVAPLSDCAPLPADEVAEASARQPSSSSARIVASLRGWLCRCPDAEWSIGLQGLRVMNCWKTSSPEGARQVMTMRERDPDVDSRGSRSTLKGRRCRQRDCRQSRTPDCRG